MKAVFDTKPGSAYDDDLLRHYQFPKRYLSIVKQTVGDWVVLRRPRADGGNLAYFAVARVVALDPDPVDPTLTFARLISARLSSAIKSTKRRSQRDCELAACDPRQQGLVRE